MLVLHHAPKSRSSRIIWLLEELRINYEIDYTNIKRRDGSGARDPNNPHPEGKVPALVHDGTLVVESTAIILYLGDRFPHKVLAPRPDDPLRASYLTWIAYYAGVIEPLLHFELLGVADDPLIRATFRGRAELDSRLLTALRAHDYIAGDRFTSADILMASLGGWMRDMLPKDPRVDAYLERCFSRPARRAAQAKDDPPA